MHLIQQRFWPDAQPLVERLGRDFFRSVPALPGVYLMRDKADAVLYVGKAKSLRHRLGSYRVANPERMARRTLRLLNLVETIRWEECLDEVAALQRESELLLALKPRFNRVGVWRGPRRYLQWRSTSSGLQFSVATGLEDGWRCLGIFGVQANYLHRALVRVLWCQLQPDRGLIGMPANWFRGEIESRTLIPFSPPVLREMVSFHLTALETGRFDLFESWLRPPASLFEERCREEDLGYLKEKFRRGPAGNLNPA